MQMLYLRRITCEKYWVRKIYAERQTKGKYHLLVQDLKLYDQDYFFRYFRLSPENFEI